MQKNILKFVFFSSYFAVVACCIDQVNNVTDLMKQPNKMFQHFITNSGEAFQVKRKEKKTKKHWPSFIKCEQKAVLSDPGAGINSCQDSRLID